MRRSVSILVAALLCAAPAFAADTHTGASGPITVPVHLTDEQKADLKRVAAYLASMKSVQGKFLQIAANGRSDQGTFYIKKPGRMRFEYMKPNPTLVISDGTTIAVENSDLHTTDRYPLVNSPLRLLLGDNPDLTNDPRIAAVKKEAGALSVTAREMSGPAQGQITLTFADSGSGQNGGLELRQWEVVDAQNQHTTLVVNEMHQVADLPAKLFIIEDLSPFKRNER